MATRSARREERGGEERGGEERGGRGARDATAGGELGDASRAPPRPGPTPACQQLARGAPRGSAHPVALSPSITLMRNFVNQANFEAFQRLYARAEAGAAAAC